MDMRAVRTIYPCDHTERRRTTEYTTIGLTVLYHGATHSYVSIIPTDIIAISIDKIFELPDSWRGCKDDWGNVDGGPYDVYENKDNPYTEPTSELQFGDTGEGVCWVQWQLIHKQQMGGVIPHPDVDDAGEEVIIPDFNSFLQQRVMKFQGLKGLPQTGKVDSATRAAMKEPFVPIHNLVADAGNYNKQRNITDNIENDCPIRPSLIDGGWYQFDPSEAYVRDLKVFSEKVDYTLDLENRLIEWNIDMSGFVGGVIGFTGLYVFKKQTTHTASDCPQCLGQNWFTDLFNPEFKTHQVTSKDKLTQDYMKALMTELNAEEGYGSTLKSLIATNIYGIDILASRFTQSVMECTERFIYSQTVALRTGQVIPNDELLEDAEITNLKISTKDGGVKADIRLYTKGGNQSSFLFQL